jgi:hypothetical protein
MVVAPSSEAKDLLTAAHAEGKSPVTLITELLRETGYKSHANRWP